MNTATLFRHLRRPLLGSLAALAAAGATPSAGAAQAEPPAARAAGTTGLTIYNDGRVLVRRALPHAVPRGRSEQRVAVGDLVPGTLIAFDTTVWVVGVRYDGAVSEESALRRAVGQQIAFLVRRPDGGRDTVTAVVLGVDPLRLQLPDGRVTFELPGTPLYPAAIAAGDPAVTLLLESRTALDSLRLGWFTRGATWHAAYDVVLAAPRARVTGSAVIESRSVGAEDAAIQLVAGDVGSAMREKVQLQAVRMAREAMADASGGAAEEQRIGEVHLYTVPGRATLRPGETVSRALFEPAAVEWERRYVVPGPPPYWGPMPRTGDEPREPVEVRYVLKRPRDGAFGRQPLPAGIARLYQPDSLGRLQLVGEAAVTHTPRGQDLELTAGTAFDITAQRVQLSYDTRQEPLGGGAVRTIITAEYEVTLTNATDSAVTVTVVEARQGDWEVVSSTIPARRISSSRVEFAVPVPAGERRSVRYTVRARW